MLVLNKFSQIAQSKTQHPKEIKHVKTLKKKLFFFFREKPTRLFFFKEMQNQESSEALKLHLVQHRLSRSEAPQHRCSTQLSAESKSAIHEPRVGT